MKFPKKKLINKYFKNYTSSPFSYLSTVHSRNLDLCQKLIEKSIILSKIN